MTDTKKTFLVLALLLGSVPAFAGGDRPWEQPAVDSELSGLETAHPLGQRLHERWRPLMSIDWQAAARDMAANFVCELGVVALALPQCFEAAEHDVLPVSRIQPDWPQILARPVEQRMQSI